MDSSCHTIHTACDIDDLAQIERQRFDRQRFERHDCRYELGERHSVGHADGCGFGPSLAVTFHGKRAIGPSSFLATTTLILCCYWRC